ncbi:hypothetical protein WJX73_009011 [Symbiochloris irregularis]|uniref:DNA (cytosine-5-)-methyltransferase n=1 Tax=Symbiochloris irregularis TaxID=706552 RepID=A0AAW1NGW6_9CHLO
MSTTAKRNRAPAGGGGRKRSKPSPKETVEESVAQETDGCWLRGAVIAKDEAARRWPDRKQARYRPLYFPKNHGAGAEERSPDELMQVAAVAHVECIELEEAEDLEEAEKKAKAAGKGATDKKAPADQPVVDIWANDEDEAGQRITFKVKLGDFVEVPNEEKLARDGVSTHNDYGRVDEIFQDEKGLRYVGLRWMYDEWNSCLKVEPKKAQPYVAAKSRPRRLFWSSQLDNKMWGTTIRANAIVRKVTVKSILPGAPPPSRQESEFYVSMTYEQEYWTLATSLEDEPATKAKWENSPHKREIAALDLYAGMGGTSYIDQEDDDCKITTKWAVDINESATSTFACNFKHAQVRCMGTDEYLVLCKEFERLCKAFPPGCAALKDKQVLGSAAMTRPTLAFTVMRADGQSRQVPESAISQLMLATYIGGLRREKAIPLPGDVGLIMGGPPCQGVSGNNRNALMENILVDGKNRQLKVFHQIIEHLQPPFVLMENVQDIHNKEGGAYFKVAMGGLLDLGYQVRSGSIDAHGMGVPQGRFRVFMWGARMDEQLCAFPMPMHKSAHIRALPLSAQGTLVTFPNMQAYEDALPPVLLGDVMGPDSDLPPVGNFNMSEAMEYKSGPASITQAWLRRDPPPDQATREERSVMADWYMDNTRRHMAEQHEQLFSSKAPKAGTKAALNNLPSEAQGWSYEGVLRVGRAYLTRESHDYTVKTVEAALRQLECDADRDYYHEQKKLHVEAITHRVGELVLEEEANARTAFGPLRDHLPLTLACGDWLRCIFVPIGEPGANFRSLPGCITNFNGQACAGHCHAAPMKQGVDTVCNGGLTRKYCQASQTARVENADRNGWRGGYLKGCDGETVVMPDSQLLVPRWTLCYMKGMSGLVGRKEEGILGGRNGCFGRMHMHRIQPTVVGRAEPHNLQLVHPEEHRVVTIRENCRCQGFPDYHALVGFAGPNQRTWARNDSLKQRFIQPGNAVCVPVAAALGRCLLKAAVGQSPVGQAVIDVPDAAYMQLVQSEYAKADGLRFLYDTLERKPAQIQINLGKLQTQVKKRELLSKGDKAGAEAIVDDDLAADEDAEADLEAEAAAEEEDEQEVEEDDDDEKMTDDDDEDVLC